MILADLTPEMLPNFKNFILSCAGTLWFLHLVYKTVLMIRGKEPQPSNEMLGHERKSISRRVHVVEGSISKIYTLLGSQKEELKKELREQTGEIIASGERRQKEINGQFQEIAATLARLDERTKKQ